jgi:glycosyltransferase involved in cell wall biosynthesis
VNPTISPEQAGAQRLADQGRQILALQSQLTQAQTQIISLRQEIDALRSSSSWRLSAWLRAPRTVALWGKKTRRSLARQLAIHNGWLGLMKDAWSALMSMRPYALTSAWAWLRSGGDISPAAGSMGLDRNDYNAWRQHRQSFENVSLPVGFHPLISVVMPLYKPPMDLLKLAIASVQDQPYTHWELCMADDASGDPALSEYLNTLVQSDARFKVHHRTENGHISACSNSALALATGQYVLLLDQDDILAPQALSLLVAALHQHPHAAVIYSDEDRMDEAGKDFFGPYFKTDFNLDLLHGQNMISHLGVYDRQLLLDIGGFRLGFEGSQDYDLALRAVESIDRARIVHIPHVLYHWRAIKGSAALDNSEKGYAAGAGRRALQEHLDRTGHKAQAEACPDLGFFNRVRYELPEPNLLVSIVVVLDEPLSKVMAMLDHMWQQRGAVACELVVSVKNQPDGLVLPAHLPPIRWVVDSKFEGAARSQRAAEEAKGTFICLVHGLFTHCSAAWLEELVSVAAQARVGFVAPRVRCEDGLIDHGGVVLTQSDTAIYAHKGLLKGSYGSAGRAILQQEFGALSHLVLVVETEKFRRLQGLSLNLPLPLAVLDTCWRWADSGLHHIWMPYADLEYGHAKYAGKINLFNDPSLTPTIKSEWNSRWKGRYIERYHNPNLSVSGDYSLDWSDQASSFNPHNA